MRRWSWACWCALLCAAAAHSAAIPEYPFVFVTGEARLQTAPDEAGGSLTVRAYAADPAAAAAVVERRTGEILRLLAAHGVAAADVRAFEISKQAMTTQSSPQEPPAIRGYQISRRIGFELRRVAEWPAIADALLAMPNVDDLNVGFDRSDRASLEAQLLRRAAADAAKRARALAESFGRRLGAAVAISQPSFDSIGPAFGFGGAPRFEGMVRSAPVAGDAHGEVPPAITVAASVNAVFRLR